MQYCCRNFCYLVIMLTGMCTLIPGMMAAKATPDELSMLLITVTGLLAFLEELMFIGDGQEPVGEMYPIYLVITTSALAYLMGDSLERVNK